MHAPFLVVHVGFRVAGPPPEPWVLDGLCHRLISRPEPGSGWQLSHEWTSRRRGRNADRRRLRRSCTLGRTPADGAAIRAGTQGANCVTVCHAGLSTRRPPDFFSSMQRAIPRQVAVLLSLRESPSASNHVVAVVRAVAAAHTWNARGVVRDANLPFELHARPVAHEASRQTPPRLPERGLPQYMHAPTKVPSSSFESPATGVSHGESRRVRDRQGGSRLVAVQARAAPFAFSEGFKVPESEHFQHGPAQLSPGLGPASTGDSSRSGFRLIASETGGAGQAAGQLRGVGTVQASWSRRATPLYGPTRTASPRTASSPASPPAVSPLALLAAKPATSRIFRVVPGSGG